MRYNFTKFLNSYIQTLLTNFEFKTEKYLFILILKKTGHAQTIKTLKYLVEYILRLKVMPTSIF